MKTIYIVCQDMWDDHGHEDDCETNICQAFSKEEDAKRIVDEYNDEGSA